MPSSSSASGSQSPPSDPQSPKSLPKSISRMARAPEDNDSQGSRSSTQGTPTRTAVDLPRSQSASKGGCWTCRLRRKKCDEQRKGDSCQTCIRLKIACLGWGSKRPEWMRDKQAVEEWKAGIKAQLMRQGLIRGQPRTSLMQSPSPGPLLQAQTRVQPYRNVRSVPNRGRSSLSNVEVDSEFTYHYVDSTRDHINANSVIHNPTLLPSISDGSSPNFHHRLSTSSFSSIDHDISPPFNFSPLPPLPPTSSPATVMAGTNDFHFDFSHLLSQDHAHTGSPSVFDYDPPSPPQNFSALASPNRGEYVIYYFNYVRRLQYIFAGNSVTNATYSLVLQDPQGAVTNAICALASLHYERKRIADGLDVNQDQSNSKLFHDEASFQIAAGKQLRGHYTESDAIAALHLISYSMFSGGLVDWRIALGIGYEWLAQTGIAVDENPALTLLTFSITGRCAIKTIMWYDIISSITTMRAPKYLALYRRLFGHTGVYWGACHLSENNLDLRSDFQSGCPDEVMIAIGEVSALAEWKASELRNGSLSVRDLIRRGDDIEQQLRQYPFSSASPGDIDQVPLHPNLVQQSEPGHVGQFPNDDMHRLTGNIYREAVILYLHTVLSDANPAVPEISASVGTIVQLLNQLPVSAVDRSLVFPICIVGCLTDDPVIRSTLRGRLQGQDQNIGNLLQTCAAMETVWQKRDSQGTTVEWRESLREQGRNLLLA